MSPFPVSSVHSFPKIMIDVIVLFFQKTNNSHSLHSNSLLFVPSLWPPPLHSIFTLPCRESSSLRGKQWRKQLFSFPHSTEPTVIRHKHEKIQKNSWLSLPDRPSSHLPSELRSYKIKPNATDDWTLLMRGGNSHDFGAVAGILGSLRAFRD